MGAPDSNILLELGTYKEEFAAGHLKRLSRKFAYSDCSFTLSHGDLVIIV